MRPTFVVLIVFAATSCGSVTKLGYPQQLVKELVVRTSCGDYESISTCLLSDIDPGRLDEIEQCYVAGGCSKTDAMVGATWFAHECWAELRDEDDQELRRRAYSTDSSSDSATGKIHKTKEESTAKETTEFSAAASSTAAPSSAAASSAAAPSSAAASTTTDSSTSDSTASATSASITSPTTSTSSSTSTSTTISDDAITTGTLLCSTTNTIQTSVCSVSAGKTLSCIATTTAVAACAAGNLCMTNRAGENTCMRIDNHVGPGGIAVAVVFGSVIAATAVGLIVMRWKDTSARRREAKRLELSGRYSKGRAKEVDVETYVPQVRSEANLPLIWERDAQGYLRQEFVENERRAPQLHQGLGALR